MNESARYPKQWLAETEASYRQYVVEWDREEAERHVETGEEPETPESWEQFLADSVYAELENSTYIEVTNLQFRGDVD